jgi:hypothetical protein
MAGGREPGQEGTRPMARNRVESHARNGEEATFEGGIHTKEDDHVDA